MLKEVKPLPREKDNYTRYLIYVDYTIFAENVIKNIYIF